jgi:hypothetical protein
MVTDSNISKVLVISDKKYADKADAREGGVGTESTIISQDIYEKVEQRKFIPVVVEFDERGKPYLPTFMKGRMYVDLSSEEKLAENYEVLLRSIFDKPLHEKPVIGKPPSFLFEEGLGATKTGFKLQMLKDAILKNKPTVKGLTVDYLKSFQSGFEDFKLTTEDHAQPRQTFIEKVKSSVRRFLPYRDEFIEFVSFVSLYIDEEGVYQTIFQFLEELTVYRDPPKGMYGYDSLTDNFRFILHELFMYLMAALIKNGKFEMANLFLTQEYLDHSRTTDYVRYDDYAAFSCVDLRTIEFETNAVHDGGWARLIKERSTHKDLDFRRLQEADLVLFLGSILHKTDFELPWVPKTLMRAHYFEVFQLFARAESHRYFESLKILLRIESKEELVAKFNAAIERQTFGGLGLRSLNIKTMINLDGLDTRP